MSTETHYVIGRTTDDKLLYEASEIDLDNDSDDAWENPRIVHGWVRPDSRASLQITSRADAEAKAAEHGGKARRVTVTTEDVGPLRWEHDPLATNMHRLLDGTKVVAVVCSHHGRCMDHSGPAYSLSPYDNGAEWFEHFTVEQAKEAAMAAVRETWT